MVKWQVNATQTLSCYENGYGSGNCNQKRIQSESNKWIAYVEKHGKCLLKSGQNALFSISHLVYILELDCCSFLGGNLDSTISANLVHWLIQVLSSNIFVFTWEIIFLKKDMNI